MSDISGIEYYEFIFCCLKEYKGKYLYLTALVTINKPISKMGVRFMKFYKTPKIKRRR